MPQFSCACEIHLNFEFLYHAVCSHLTSHVSNVHEFLSLFTCDAKDYNCMSGNCTACKDIKSKFSAVTKNHRTKVDIKQWQKEGNFSKIVTTSKSVGSIVEKYSKQIQTFKFHTFVSKLQSKKKTEDLKNLPPGAALVMVDFSENETLIPQHEAQVGYWARKNLSVFTVTLYITPDENSATDEIQTRSICIVSDNLEHNSHASNAYMREVLDYIKKEFPHIANVIVWSDGAPSHFKNKFNIANMLQLEKDYGYKIEWNFFGTSHGKSPCDGIGGNVKRMVNDRVKSQNLSIQNAAQFVEQAKVICDKFEVWLLEHQKIEQLAVDYEQWKQHVKSITGIRNQHKFETFGSDSIKSFQTSYGHSQKIHKVI